MSNHHVSEAEQGRDSPTHARCSIPGAEGTGLSRCGMRPPPGQQQTPQSRWWVHNHGAMPRNREVEEFSGHSGLSYCRGRRRGAPPQRGARYPAPPPPGPGICLVTGGGGVNYETHQPRTWENPGSQNCRGGGGRWTANPAPTHPPHERWTSFQKFQKFLKHKSSLFIVVTVRVT